MSPAGVRGGLPHDCAPSLWPGILQARLDQAHTPWLVENRGMPGMTAGVIHDVKRHKSREQFYRFKLRADGTTGEIHGPKSLTEAIKLYHDNGYREVERFNDEPYADHWFEKVL